VILAHVAGVPVEEILLSFAPMGVIGIGAAVLSAGGRFRLFGHRDVHRRTASAADADLLRHLHRVHRDR
jgi:hypothetical protein